MASKQEKLDMKEVEKEVDKMLSKIKDDKVELCKDKKTWFIRKGLCRPCCVCSKLNEKDLESLYKKIGKFLGKIDWKKEMEKDKKKFIGPTRLLGNSEIIIKKGKFKIK